MIVYVYVAIVQPIARKGLACCGLALRYLIFVMREYKILPAGMHVKGFAKYAHAHGAAFYVPARPSLAPGRIPARLAGLCALPYGKIEGILLLLGRVYPCAAFKAVYALAGKLAVAGKAPYGKIHVAIVGRVSMAHIYKLLHKLYYVVDMLGSPRVACGPFGAKPVGIGIVFFYVLFSKRGNGGVLLIGSSYQLVVYIGKVGYKFNLVAPVFKVAAHRIEHHKRPCVAYVYKVIYGRPAYIHFYYARGHRHKLLLAPRHRVIYIHISVSPYRIKLN